MRVAMSTVHFLKDQHRNSSFVFSIRGTQYYVLVISLEKMQNRSLLYLPVYVWYGRREQ